MAEAGAHTHGRQVAEAVVAAHAHAVGAETETRVAAVHIVLAKVHRATEPQSQRLLLRVGLLRHVRQAAGGAADIDLLPFIAAETGAWLAQGRLAHERFDGRAEHAVRFIRLPARQRRRRIAAVVWRRQAQAEAGTPPAIAMQAFQALREVRQLCAGETPRRVRLRRLQADHFRIDRRIAPRRHRHVDDTRLRGGIRIAQGVADDGRAGELARGRKAQLVRRLAGRAHIAHHHLARFRRRHAQHIRRRERATRGARRQVDIDRQAGHHRDALAEHLRHRIDGNRRGHRRRGAEGVRHGIADADLAAGIDAWRVDDVHAIDHRRAAGRLRCDGHGRERPARGALRHIQGHRRAGQDRRRLGDRYGDGPRRHRHADRRGGGGAARTRRRVAEGVRTEVVGIGHIHHLEGAIAAARRAARHHRDGAMLRRRDDGHCRDRAAIRGGDGQTHFLVGRRRRRFIGHRRRRLVHQQGQGLLHRELVRVLRLHGEVVAARHRRRAAQHTGRRIERQARRQGAAAHGICIRRHAAASRECLAVRVAGTDRRQAGRRQAQGGFRHGQGVAVGGAERRPHARAAVLDLDADREAARHIGGAGQYAGRRIQGQAGRQGAAADAEGMWRRAARRRQGCAVGRFRRWIGQAGWRQADRGRCDSQRIALRAGELVRIFRLHGQGKTAGRRRRAAEQTAAVQGQAGRQVAARDRIDIRSDAAAGRQLLAVRRGDSRRRQRCRRDRDRRRADAQGITVGGAERRTRARAAVRDLDAERETARHIRRAGQYARGRIQAQASGQGTAADAEGVRRRAARCSQGGRVGRFRCRIGQGGWRQADIGRRHHQGVALRAGKLVRIGRLHGQRETATRRWRTAEQTTATQRQARRQAACRHRVGIGSDAAAGRQLLAVCRGHFRHRQRTWRHRDYGGNDCQGIAVAGTERCPRAGAAVRDLDADREAAGHIGRAGQHAGGRIQAQADGQGATGHTIGIRRRAARRRQGRSVGCLRRRIGQGGRGQADARIAYCDRHCG
ncbi:hypothetical protein VM94_04806 [Janthinobacterium sp. KBS0711]|nr:hypothetical protein VM94_04806 [Janthinobacterium sp. KBS0711]